MFFPGKVWNDTQGQPIQAHGGGILYEQGTYYWFGENKAGPTLTVPPFGGKRVDVIGISCYASTDLVSWRNEGIVLPAVPDQPDHDLYPGKVVERPKVIYNRSTHTYVMWMHVDTPNYAYARAGVAVSSTPTGPYHYLGSIAPCETDCRDLTVFQDDDGKAYLIFASELNRNITVVQLSEDYLTTTESFVKLFTHPHPHEGREAPAVFKDAGNYYMITSACSGWDSNAAECAVASSLFSPWQILGNPCVGAGASQTFGGQGTFILPVPGCKHTFIFMADRWNPENLSDSRYLWLPLQVCEKRPVIAWHDSWNCSLFERTVNISM